MTQPKAAYVYGEAPEGSWVAYQLREEPSRADISPKKRSRQTPRMIEPGSGNNEGGDDNLRLIVTFPPLPFSQPPLRKLRDGEKEWPISLHAAQALEGRTRQQAGNDEWRSLHKHVITSSNFGKVAHSTRTLASLLEFCLTVPPLTMFHQ